MKKSLFVLLICSALMGSSEVRAQEAMIGEVRLFAGNFAPRGWAFCEGQLLSISQNTALFSILGTIYGGDGRTTFGLPDLRGRVPVGVGNGPGLDEVRIGQNATAGADGKGGQPTLGMHYIIAIQGTFPSRN